MCFGCRDCCHGNRSGTSFYYIIRFPYEDYSPHAKNVLFLPEMFVQGVRRFGFTAYRAAEAVNSYAVRLAKEQGNVNGLVGGMNP